MAHVHDFADERSALGGAGRLAAAPALTSADQQPRTRADPRPLTRSVRGGRGGTFRSAAARPLARRADRHHAFGEHAPVEPEDRTPGEVQSPPAAQAPPLDEDLIALRD